MLFELSRHARPRRPRRRFAWILAALLTWVALSFTPAVGAGTAERSPLPAEEAVDARHFGAYSPIAFSADGEMLAYVAERGVPPDYTSDEFPRTGVPVSDAHADIYVLNIKTDKARNLTRGIGGNWKPNWSPDGRYLAFLSDRDGSGQAKLWVWDAAKDRLRKTCDLDARGDEMEWTADSQSIFFTVLPEGLSVKDYIHLFSSTSERQPTNSRASGPSTVVLYQSEPANTVSSDPWSLNWALRDLAVVRIASGETTRVVHGQRISKFLLSPDDSRLAYTRPQRFERPGSQQTIFDLVSVSLTTGGERLAAPDLPLGLGGEEFSWSPDGVTLGYCTEGGSERANDCYIVDSRHGSPRDITAFSLEKERARWSLGVPLWDATGERFYFLRDKELWSAQPAGGSVHEVAAIPNRSIVKLIAQSAGRLCMLEAGTWTVVLAHDKAAEEDGFYKVNLRNGQTERLLEDGQCFTCAQQEQPVTVAGHGHEIAFFAETSEHDSNIWVADAGFRDPRPLTDLNPQFEKYSMGAAKLIHWLDDDGEELQGALLLPPGYQPGTRCPLLVWVYGGALLANKLNQFGMGNWGPFNMQLFATRGYAVLLPDSPQREGQPMLDLVKTVLPGVNEVVAMGIADPRRLGVFGHSNGGYSVISLISQTNRFRAAIEMDGMADLIGEYGEMAKSGAAFGTALLEHSQDVMGGTLWQFRGRYIDNSPVFYLDRIETPLLIVHGSDDDAVGSFLGDELFVDLRRLGKEAEYAKYGGEGHSPLYWSRANQLDLCQRVIGWFDKYVKDSPGPGSSASTTLSH